MLCNVVRIHASHLLLGRLCQYARKAIHYWFKNRFSFVKDGKFVAFISLIPKQVYKDQFKLKRENTDESKSLYVKERFIQNIFFPNKTMQGL
jgi:hypothetical protein